MNLSELRSKIVKKSINLERESHAGSNGTPAHSQHTDPYWDRRIPEGSYESPFTQSLRRMAEHAGQRITPPQTQKVAGKSDNQSSKLLRMSCGRCGMIGSTCPVTCICQCHSIGQAKSTEMSNFMEAIEEAAERNGHCPRCRGEKPWSETCTKCRPAPDCAYCGAKQEDPEDDGCHFCREHGVNKLAKKEKQPPLVLEMPYKLIAPHSVLIVDEKGTVNRHYTHTDESGRSYITIDGKEIEV